MKILLDLNGWTKVVEVPFHSSYSRTIEVDVYPPMDRFVDSPASITDDAVRVVFSHSGHKRDMPIFKYEAYNQSLEPTIKVGAFS